MPQPLSNKAKYFLFLAAAIGYGIAFGELWSRYLVSWLSSFPQSIRTILFSIPFYIPMLILGSIAISYINKSKDEQDEKAKALQTEGNRGWKSKWARTRLAGRNRFLVRMVLVNGVATGALFAAILMLLKPHFFGTDIGSVEWAILAFCLCSGLALIHAWRCWDVAERTYLAHAPDHRAK